MIADTTPADHWVGQMIVGVGVAILATRRRVSDHRHVAIGAVLTAIVATAFDVTYAGNMIALLCSDPQVVAA